MRYFVCLAGFPAEITREVQNRSAAEFTGEKSNSPIVKPINAPFSYRRGMSDPYLVELNRRFQSLTTKEDACVVLCYASYPGENTVEFTNCFFPFALAIPIQPIYVDTFAKHERRKAVSEYVDRLVEVTRTGRIKSRAVKDAFSGANFTPLLLPLRNFRSDILLPTIDKLFRNIALSDTRLAIDEARKMLIARHPLKRDPVNRERLPYFTDDRNLMFKSPGRNRHGMARGSKEGHRSSCLINGRVRLGGSFDALFHYDCEYTDGGVDRAYPNCHGIDDKPAQATHVNIAPNDAIR